MNRKRQLVVLFALVLFTVACEGTLSTPVQVSRYAYNPHLDQAKFAEYKGQTIIFDSIEAEAPNVTNFHYFSPDREFAYDLFYSPQHMQQPMVSFFWYTLEKTFSSIGMTVKEAGPIKNIPQIHLKFVSLTDQEARIIVSVSRNGYLLLQKKVLVAQKLPATKNVSELQKRSYDFFDLMAVTILSDPDVKREFFSDKGRIN